MDILSTPIQMLGGLGRRAGNRVLEVTGSDKAAAVVDTVIQGTSLFLPYMKRGAKALGRTARATPKTIKHGPGYLWNRMVIDKGKSKSYTLKRKIEDLEYNRAGLIEDMIDMRKRGYDKRSSG